VTDNQADFEIQAVSVLHLSFCAECAIIQCPSQIIIAWIQIWSFRRL